MKSGFSFVVAAAVSLVAGAAQAAEVVDQSQTMIDAGSGLLGIGGDSEQKLAQSFTAGVTGTMVAIRAPIIGCAGGDLVLEVRLAGAGGAPDGALLNSTRVAPSSVPVTGAAFHEMRLNATVAIRRGVKYAYTLRMDPVASTSNCNYVHSAVGDLYADGEHFFDSRPNPPGWVAASAVPEPRLDLAFETIVDTGSPAPVASGDCYIPGGAAGMAPIPDFLPVCRCLRDAGLREFRCALLNPDFFAIRRIPWPIPFGAPYRETWEVLPMTKLSDAVRIELKGANIGEPINMSFAGKSRKALETRVSTFTAPKEATAVPGVATIRYGQQTWTIDTTIPADAFEAGGLPGKQDLPKGLPKKP